jgi:hypothetical protein
MSNKSLLKFGAAFVVLAAVLIFLGVNFVPRIYASSSAQRNVVIAGKQTRSDYVDESYPRAILDPRILQSNTQSANYYTGSDWVERHPSSYLSNSDWVDRHPNTYSDWIDHLSSQPSQ